MVFESFTLFSDLKWNAAIVVVVGRFDSAALELSVRKLVENDTNNRRENDGYSLSKFDLIAIGIFTNSE